MLGDIKEVLLFKLMMVLWLCVIMSEMVYVLDLVCNIPGLQERGREREILKLNNWVYGDLLYSYLFQVVKNCSLFSVQISRALHRRKLL